MTFNLTVLGTREVRGRILPVNGWDLEAPLVPTVDGNDCFGISADNCTLAPDYCIRQGWCRAFSGGYAKLAGYAEQLHKETPNVLTVDPGNFYYGMAYGRPDDYASINRLLGEMLFREDAERSNKPLYDAMGIGLSDFMDETLGFKVLMESSTIQRVMSNYDISGDPILSSCRNMNGDPCIENYIILSKDQRKIAILGAATENIHEMLGIETMVPIGVVKALQGTVDELHREHPDVNIIVLMSSLSRYANDEVALRVPGIDVIVASAETGFLVPPSERHYTNFNEKREYVRVIRNAGTGERTFILHGPGWGVGFGRLDLSFDSNGTVVGYDESTAGIVALNFEFDSESRPIHGHYFNLNVSREVKRIVGRAAEFEVKDVVAVLDSELYGHWGDGNDRGWLPDYRGLGCRFPTKLMQEGDTCEDNKEKLPFLLRTQESPTREACCPFEAVTERACGPEYCEPTIDPITNTWTYPRSDGLNIDACCLYNSYNNGDTNRGCCPVDVHWEVSGCRNSDCPFGYIVTDALMHECKNCDMVFTNGASIRGNLEGNVTYRDLSNIFSFGNSFSTFRIPAEVLVEVMEVSVSRYQAYYGGFFMHIAGARLIYHPGKGKLFQLDICSDWDRETDACVGEWRDAMENPTQLLRVGTNNYLREGNSGFTMLGDDSSNLVDVNDYGAKIQDYVANFFRKKTRIQPQSMQSIKRNCGGYIHNYVEHWKSHPECRTLKISNPFPETCPQNPETVATCVATSEPSFEIGDLQIIMQQNTSCYECSGFGTCESQLGYTCRCHESVVKGFEYPQQHRPLEPTSTGNLCDSIAGRKGIVMMKGDYCDVPRERFDTSTGGIGLVTGLLVLVGGLLLLTTTVISWKSMSASINHPFYVTTTSIGIILGGVGCIGSSWEPSIVACNAIPSLAFIAITVTLSGTFLKQATIWYSLQKMQRGEKKLELEFTTIVMAYCILVGVGVAEIAWLVAQFPIKPTIVELDPAVSDFAFAVECKVQDRYGNSQALIWLVALVGYHHFLSIGTLIQVFITKRLLPMASLKHFQLVLGITYNTMFLETITIIATFYVGINPSMERIVWMVGLFLISFTNVVFVAWQNKVSVSITPLTSTRTKEI